MYTEATHIIKNEALVKRLEGYTQINDTIKRTRTYGITGKFEIHHILQHENSQYIVSITAVNEHDRVISVIYP
jgi:hypothetical protein